MTLPAAGAATTEPPPVVLAYLEVAVLIGDHSVTLYSLAPPTLRVKVPAFAVFPTHTERYPPKVGTLTSLTIDQVALAPETLVE